LHQTNIGWLGGILKCVKSQTGRMAVSLSQKRRLILRSVDDPWVVFISGDRKP